MRKEGEKRRKKTGPRYLLLTLFIQNKFTWLFLNIIFSAGRRPGKQQKKEQPRRVRSLEDQLGHLEDIEHFYEQGNRDRQIIGEKLLEVTRKENSSSLAREEQKPFVFN